MKLVITDTIFDDFPEMVLGVVILHKIDNSQHRPEITEMLRQAEATLPGKFGSTPIILQHGGKKEVRAGLAKRFEGIPDVHYGDDRHWSCGDFGVSEWTLTDTSTSGQPIEVRGVDPLEFAQGKIIRKDSFWKILE